MLQLQHVINTTSMENYENEIRRFAFLSNKVERKVF